MIPQSLAQHRAKLEAWMELYSRPLSIALFVAGFVFDTLTLSRIDSPIQILQQLAYLLIVATLIIINFLEESGEYPMHRRLLQLGAYREPAIHFLLGSLLSCYTIFYFKSASLAASSLFVSFLATLLLINEFKRFGKLRTPLHVALFGLCLTSFWIYIVPVLLGFIGALAFILAIALSVLAALPAYRWLRTRVKARGRRFLVKNLVAPFFAVQALFAGLYFTKLLPPIPLSLQEIGIYHLIEKVEGGYRLSYSRSAWRFWESGAQTFNARPDDKVYAFARIFSPTRFREQLLVRWSLKDPSRGWIEQDAIPFEVVGGRDAGYRGFTYKANYQPGDWRIQILTSDRREVGRISLRIIPDASTEERQMKVEMR